MVKTVAKRKNQKACSAGIKEEEKKVGSRVPAALTELTATALLQEVKAEQVNFGEAVVKEVIKINKQRSSPWFKSKFQPKFENQQIREEANVVKTQYKQEIIGLEDLLAISAVKANSQEDAVTE